MSLCSEPPDLPRGDPLRFTASEAEVGERVDVALSALAGVARSAVRRWIDAGQVTINGRTCRASRRVALGDELGDEMGDEFGDEEYDDEEMGDEEYDDEEMDPLMNGDEEEEMLRIKKGMRHMRHIDNWHL